MRRSIMLPVFGTAVAILSPLANAREVVVLPGVVSPVGVASGVDTQGPGTLTVGSQNINTGNDPGGAVTTDAANTASIVFGNTSTVTGFVGRTGTTFLNIAAGSNGNTVTFNGPVFATTFSVTGAGTVNFNGGFTSNTGSTLDFGGDGFINVGAGQTVKAAVTNTAGANTGTLTLNGNSILDGAVGAASGIKAINLTTGNALITGQAKAASFTLGTNTLNVAGALAIPVAGTINTTIFSLNSYGKIVPVGAATIGNGLQVRVTVTGPIANGSSFNIVDATSGTSGSTVIATSNTTRYQFSAAPTTNGLVRITTTQIPLVEVVTPVVTPPSTTPPVTPPATTPVTPVTTPPVVVPIVPAINPVIPVVVAPVIDALPLTPVTVPILTAITLLPTAPEVANALAQLAPGIANFAAPQVSYKATQRFQEQWASHLEMVQRACGQPGEADDRNILRLEEAASCQERGRRSNLWSTAFGYLGEQSTVRGYEGYDFHILGATLAYDTPISDSARAGLGMRYAKSSLSAQNTNAHGSIESYQATAYLGYAPGAWFANAALAYGWDNYKGSRRVIFPGIDATANAHYHGRQFTAYGTTGYHFYLGSAQTVLTPVATLQYTRLHANAYTETGGDALNLHVERQNYEFMQSGLGLKLTRAFTTSSGPVVRPELRANWLHSFGGETMANTAAFASGGPNFVAQGLKPKRDSFATGLGIEVSDGPLSMMAGYDYQWRNDSYRAQQVMVRLALHL